MLRWSVGLIPWRAPMYSTASAWGINLQLLFNSPLITAILDFLQERLNGSDWHGWTYVSKGHNDGDGDGTEKHDHAQGKQDALVRRDIDLQQAKSKRIARRIHLTVTAFLFCCPKSVKLWWALHLALEAEDGDRETHQSCDAQAQQHGLGVVKAAGGVKHIYFTKLFYRCCLEKKISVSNIFTLTQIPSWRKCSKSARGRGKKAIIDHAVFQHAVPFFILWNTHKENQQNDVPGKLPPVQVGQKTICLWIGIRASVLCLPSWTIVWSFRVRRHVTSDLHSRTARCRWRRTWYYKGERMKQRFKK